jgi:hypothetical protein
MTVDQIRAIEIPDVDEPIRGNKPAVQINAMTCFLQEIAVQLAELNWNVSELRNHQSPFPVQIEPGQYPIVIRKL